MHEADRVIAVSSLTKGIVVNRYGVAEDRVHVVHNGIDPKPPCPRRRRTRPERIVLFLGRLTMQKGPEFLVRAARRILEKIDNVRFLTAGWGDLGPKIIEQVVAMGLGHKVQFMGFVRGKEVEQT